MNNLELPEAQTFFDCVTPCGDIDHILAVKADRPSQKARPHKIRLL